ncbi:nitroreductase family protein [Litorilinea aerophila]|uniref:Nitroreductase family protein n=1 Tax=Litorilinea aerophila TaxID=1204385 RepID=A0A540V8R8_9CHLR|nr:nitroreductase family protein [Litorilinea aerophila]MCC9078916.1 nitroreductase family protein [Litorilinea aerophila]
MSGNGEEQRLVAEAATSDPEKVLSPSAFPWEGFWTLIRGRRSIRRYQARPVERETLLKLLDAARWAPSAHNRQPWRFCVVTGEATRQALALRMGERWRQDLAADGADSAFIERRVAISQARLTAAPALIVAALSMDEMDQYPDVRRNQAEWTMAVQSVALACQNLLLAAHALGLGACWMCAPLFVPELVRDVLDLPPTWHPQALITVGYPAEERQRERAPLESRVVWR